MNFESKISNRFYYGSLKNSKYLGWLSMIGMGIGCFAMVIAISVIYGFEKHIHNKLKGFEGDLRVYDFNQFDEIEKINAIKTAMPFMERRALIETKSSKRVVTIKAVKQLDESFYDLNLEGLMPTNRHIVIGKDLAMRLGIDIGDIITLSSPIDQTFGLSIPEKKKFKISGIFSTNILDYDDRFVFITLNDGEKLFKRKRNIDGYDIRINNGHSVYEVKKSLNEIFGYQVEIKTWDEQNKSLVDAMKMERYGTMIILSLIFLIAAFNLGSNLILISIQKMKDVGILRIMGAKKYSIMRIIIYLGVKRASYGAIFGLLFGLLIVLVQNKFSIIPLPYEVYFIDTLPMAVRFIDIIIIFFLSFCFILLASFISSRKLAYMNLKRSIQWMK